MKNKYEVRGDETVIFCWGKGRWYEAFIDTEDLCIANSKPNTWSVNTHKKNSIYHRQQVGGVVEGTYLHRLVTDAPEGLDVDHIDGNPLQNCKFNLRIVAHRENLQNLPQGRTNNSSGYRGVSYKKNYHKWEAYYWVDYHKNHVGYYDNAEAANAAVVKARAEYMPFSLDFREAA